MEPIAYTQQLNELLDTVNEMTADSISFWHQTLAGEVRSSVAKIEQLAVAANQASFVQQMAQVFDQQEQAILETLELPLKALRELVDSGHLSEPQKARLLIQLGKTHDLLSQWEQALDQFYRALDYCQDTLPEKAEILKFIGHIKSKQREYNSAQSQYHASIEAYSELQNQREVANIYLCLGFNDFESGRHQSAEENYRNAQHIANSLEGAERIIGDVNLTLGILATMRGDFQTALSHYEQSVQSYESMGDERGLSQAYYNMGMLYVDMKEWASAGESYQRSLERARKSSDLYLIGHIHLSTTELALQLSDLALAQAACMQAVKVFGRLGGQTQLSEAYKYAGLIQRRRRAWDKANRLFQQSIELAKKSQSSLNEAEARYEYGLMLLDKLDPDQARIQFNAALTIFTKLGAQVDVQKTQKALEQLDESKPEAEERRCFKPIKRS